MTLCECGCGKIVNKDRRFIQGHNIKVNSKINTTETKRKAVRTRKISKEIKEDKRPAPKPTLCECGCGQLCKIGSRFIRGHQTRINNPMNNSESRKKVGDSRRGKHLSKSTKQKISKSRLGDKNPMKNPEISKKVSKALLGRTKEEYEYLRRAGEKRKGRTKENHEGVRRMAEKKTGRTKEEYEYLRKYSEKMTGRTGKDYEYIRIASEKRNVYYKNPLWIRKQSETMKIFWQDPEYIEKQIKSFHMKPNKPEKYLQKILDTIFPNEYVYNGDFSAKVVVDGKIPDFVCGNKIIELFGDYWHRNDNPKDKIDFYKQHKYNCLVIWEHELDDTNSLLDKLINFHTSLR